MNAQTAWDLAHGVPLTRGRQCDAAQVAKTDWPLIAIRSPLPTQGPDPGVGPFGTDTIQA